MTEPELLTACRVALGFSTQRLAKFLAYKEDRRLRRAEKGEIPVSTLLWLLMFFMLRDAGKRDLMNDVHKIILARREAA